MADGTLVHIEFETPEGDLIALEPDQTYLVIEESVQLSGDGDYTFVYRVEPIKS